MKIYTITGIPYNYPKSRTRCFGFREKFSDAAKDVSYNSGDMDEGSFYEHIVIEEIEDGVWMLSGNAYWYEWNGQEYCPIDRPLAFKHIVNWSIG